MRRNWFIAAIVIGIAAIVIAAIVMRLTEDAPPSTAEWADTVCADLVDWRETISSLADTSGETLTPDLLREKVDDAKTATSILIIDLRELGSPDVESGDELEEQLDASVSELESSFDELTEASDQVRDARDREDFVQELAGLVSQFSAFVGAIQSTVETLQNADVVPESKAELQQAFADAPSCQSLQADG